jgi:hypothetical protein
MHSACMKTSADLMGGGVKDGLRMIVSICRSRRENGIGMRTRRVARDWKESS